MRIRKRLRRRRVDVHPAHVLRRAAPADLNRADQVAALRRRRRRERPRVGPEPKRRCILRARHNVDVRKDGIGVAADDERVARKCPDRRVRRRAHVDDPVGAARRQIDAHRPGRKRQIRHARNQARARHIAAVVGPLANRPVLVRERQRIGRRRRVGDAVAGDGGRGARDVRPRHIAAGTRRDLRPRIRPGTAPESGGRPTRDREQFEPRRVHTARRRQRGTPRDNQSRYHLGERRQSEHQGEQAADQDRMESSHQYTTWARITCWPLSSTTNDTVRLGDVPCATMSGSDGVRV